MDPLIQAVLRKDLEGLRHSLVARSDVDVRDGDGRTPLMHAAIEGHVEAIRLLVRAGANVNLSDDRGLAPLHFAAQEFHTEAARVLLMAGAEVNAKDGFGNTPLAKAVFGSRGKGEMIRLLVAHGADKSLKNDHGVSPEDLAAKIANYDVAKFL
jgi:ankyrin repeat protein